MSTYADAGGTMRDWINSRTATLVGLVVDQIVGAYMSRCFTGAAFEDDWAERIWILCLTLGTCVAAGAVYALVRTLQTRRPAEADTDEDEGSVGADQVS